MNILLINLITISPSKFLELYKLGSRQKGAIIIDFLVIFDAFGTRTEPYSFPKTARAKSPIRTSTLQLPTINSVIAFSVLEIYQFSFFYSDSA